MALVRSTLKLRLDPTPQEAEGLARLAGGRRWVWNWALARRQTSLQEDGKAVGWGELSAELTALKQAPDTAWLKEMDSQSLQQSLADLRDAFGAFFAKRAGLSTVA